MKSRGKAISTAYAASLGYSEEELGTVPRDAVASHGCGNPVALSGLRQGETVLDLGCGGGLDAFLAAQRVGPTGRVVGVDVASEMVRKANQNARKARLGNVEFKHAPIERLPLRDASVDVAISNCVMNHCPDKVRAFKEVYRVLKAGGRMCISDLVSSGSFSKAALKDEVWGEWLKNAQTKNDYLRAVEIAGFKEITLEGEEPFPMAENNKRLKGRIASILLTARKQREDGKDRTDIAVARFLAGYNCAQAVLYAFRDEAGLGEDLALKLATGLGAGMGRKQEVCGAVTGGILVLGLRHGRGSTDDHSATEHTYLKTRKLMDRFAAEHGSCLCRTLLRGYNLATTEGRRRAHADHMLDKVCRPCVRTIVTILEQWEQA